MIERIVEAMLDKAFTDAYHGIAAHLKGLGHLLVGPLVVRCLAINFELDAGMGQLTGGRFARGNQAMQSGALVLTQGHLVFVSTAFHGSLLEYSLLQFFFKDITCCFLLQRLCDRLLPDYPPFCNRTATLCSKSYDDRDDQPNQS